MTKLIALVDMSSLAVYRPFCLECGSGNLAFRLVKKVFKHFEIKEKFVFRLSCEACGSYKIVISVNNLGKR